MGNRTGFLLANIHQGSSIRMLAAISEEARRREGASVFVFPGGRLSYRDSSEHLRNQIYSLCNDKNIDRAIVWSSSLTGKVNFDEVGEFVQKLNSNIPTVSLGQSIDNIPSVDFDAYNGVFEEVEHLIKVHGCRRIAFIRGPETHLSSQRRFQAYKDALKANGIEYDPRIVSTPRAWSDGKASMIELVEERGLKPHVDFDAIAFASDLLMFWASKYLEKININIPHDVIATGFNDSDENAMMAVPATTVRMPIRELVKASFELSEDISIDSRLSSVDMVLPTRMIIRGSCGCEDSFGGIENARRIVSSWSGLRAWIENTTEDNECCDSLYTLLREIYLGSDLFDDKAKLGALLCDYFEKGGKYELVFESIKWIEAFLSDKHLTTDERDILYSQMAYQNSRSNAYKEFASRTVTAQVDKFKLELLATSNYITLVEKMKEYLPRIGISKAFICTYESDTATKLACGFSRYAIVQGGEVFPSELLLDPRYSNELENGFFVVEPLVYDNYSVGYLILETSCLDGAILEDIRTSISTTIKGIRLFDFASEKSRKAEDTEKQSIDFYSTFSEGIREPLESIKRLVSSSSIDGKAIDLQVTQALHLLELSLAEIGEIELSLKLEPLSHLVEQASKMGISVDSRHDLPAIEIDEIRMEEVCGILASEISKVDDSPEVSIEVESTSVSFIFSGRKGIWNPSIVEKNSSFMLAEKIVLLHHGFFSYSSTGISISIPFQSLSGEIRGGSTIGTVLFISNDSYIPDSIRHLDLLAVNEEELLSDFSISSNIVAIALSALPNKRPTAILLNLLKNHVSTKALSFMLFDLPQESISLSTALEGSVSEIERATIFSFGAFPETLSKLSEFGSVLEANTLSEAEESEGRGALAIFYKLDIDIINSLRASRKFNKTPILIVKDYFEMEEAESLAEIPNVLIVNPSITESEEFVSKIVGIFGGGELLPPLTSVLVKKAIAYLNKNASSQISRWQLAEAVNISEDYLTRIFRKEVGTSPWDYLNRYRIQLACRLLTQTGLSINEIAQDTGFQDQAYFCRVFKKVKGFPPGHIRQRI